ncbi:NADH-quinone oxidoreductase subunit J family protein [Chryseolinea lacunae]|uniref:NADH-quinone oxidoreductase subunit J n=1 Tax=Chryseolinea lacunae TaxID=2801331 RepID=A0ABS1KTM6_9BACT|nr:NADH-quinone oxidoreductase subunit J [Chryseolinea lacunae]MBL0742543.1 NADH-quinone oxidoreductase subunit J [Chryseolinea lacunae]
MNAPLILFYFFEAAAAIAAVALLFARSVFYGALLVIVILLALAGLYVLAFAEFVAVTQILVYAGGILVVIIFGIMLTSRLSGKPLVVEHTLPVSGGLVGLAFFGALVYAIALQTFPTSESVAKTSTTFDATQTVGIALMSDYVLPFETTGILLLMALIGAAVMASDNASKKI